MCVQRQCVVYNNVYEPMSGAAIMLALVVLVGLRQVSCARASLRRQQHRLLTSPPGSLATASTITLPLPLLRSTTACRCRTSVCVRVRRVTHFKNVEDDVEAANQSC